MTRTLQAATPLEDILEKDWQRQVVDLAKQLGWITYHTYNSRRSTHGFPDLVLVRERVIYLECKRENRVTSKLTDEQKVWLNRLEAAGAEVYVMRPSQLQELADILAARRAPIYRPTFPDE
jgi:SH3-like domain-containing protein